MRLQDFALQRAILFDLAPHVVNQGSQLALSLRLHNAQLLTTIREIRGFGVFDGHRKTQSSAAQFNRPKLAVGHINRVIGAKATAMPMQVHDTLTARGPDQQPALLRMHQLQRPRRRLTQLSQCHHLNRL